MPSRTCGNSAPSCFLSVELEVWLAFFYLLSPFSITEDHPSYILPTIILFLYIQYYIFIIFVFVTFMLLLSINNQSINHYSTTLVRAWRSRHMTQRLVCFVQLGLWEAHVIIPANNNVILALHRVVSARAAPRHHPVCLKQPGAQRLYIDWSRLVSNSTIDTFVFDRRC